MGELQRVKGLGELIRKVPTIYRAEVESFAKFLDVSGLTVDRAGITKYLAELRKRKRRTSSGQETAYSASWYNRNLKAIKGAVRWLLDNSPELTNGARYQVEKYLKSLKQEKQKDGISKEERVPTRAEVKKMVAEADKRLALMIEFLAQTGARISEMIGAEVGQSRRSTRITRVRVKGKGDRERDLRLKTELFDRIRAEFKGKQYLFEHGGKQYNRMAVTNRIKMLGRLSIGKAVTAHMLRHYRGTELTEKVGLSKASTELGHKDVSVTKKFYVHDRLTDSDFLKSLED